MFKEVGVLGGNADFGFQKNLLSLLSLVFPHFQRSVSESVKQECIACTVLIHRTQNKRFWLNLTI